MNKKSDMRFGDIWWFVRGKSKFTATHVYPASLVERVTENYVQVKGFYAETEMVPKNEIFCAELLYRQEGL